MSRVTGAAYDGYDDVYGLLASGRWERNSRATVESKRGQKVLRELEAAMLALPKPRLARDLFCSVGEDDGDVEACVLGAYAIWKGEARHVPPEYNDTSDWRDEVETSADEQARWAENHLGLAFTLAWNLIERNDDILGHFTPEERYTRMLAWIRANLKP